MMIYFYHSKGKGKQEKGEPKKFNIKVKVTAFFETTNCELGIHRGEVSRDREKWMSWPATEKIPCDELVNNNLVSEVDEVKLRFEIKIM